MKCGVRDECTLHMKMEINGRLDESQVVRNMVNVRIYSGRDEGTEEAKPKVQGTGSGTLSGGLMFADTN